MMIRRPLAANLVFDSSDSIPSLRNGDTRIGVTHIYSFVRTSSGEIYKLCINMTNQAGAPGLKANMVLLGPVVMPRREATLDRSHP